ncbi:MAG TPA: DUF1127 domain-containing protein [Hypericibacter adhaerens]|jgi:uncharacterized protein YjiS (DUF1127 family)|uniref:YjiS-like domain-containing protein n=1 Tax=Hypericibacter adhaerens TaxID=2602016 RepID=A0A5J6MUU3_9PROT|nr:DUF1127 domain-containing protein [Hypericibacter adhaerens]QEX20923.1 hypothetical protein FRZ61_08430 [Hypericibacter adhaerens]HWA42670.1 DUF1127 domain-containing protein [Hypericibacter adhaerens]
MSLGQFIVATAVALPSAVKIPSAALLAKSVGLSALAVGILKFIRGRRDLRLLTQMDAHQLHDIGLTEADIGYARSLPFAQDPTACLARRVTERGERPSRPARHG